MIEFVKTTFDCGHVEYSGSTFGYPVDEAEKYAREAGYFEEDTVEAPCSRCKKVS